MKKRIVLQMNMKVSVETEETDPEKIFNTLSIEIKSAKDEKVLGPELTDIYLHDVQKIS